MDEQKRIKIANAAKSILQAEMYEPQEGADPPDVDSYCERVKARVTKIQQQQSTPGYFLTLKEEYLLGCHKMLAQVHEVLKTISNWEFNYVPLTQQDMDTLISGRDAFSAMRQYERFEEPGEECETDVLAKERHDCILRSLLSLPIYTRALAQMIGFDKGASNGVSGPNP